MSTEIRPSTPSPLHKSLNDAMAAPSPIMNPSVASSTKKNAYTPERRSTGSHFSTSVNDVSSLNDRLRDINFNSPAKIFQNRNAVHRFENVTPDPGSPAPGMLPNHHQYNYDSDADTAGTQTPTQTETPRSLSPEINDSSTSINYATPPPNQSTTPNDGSTDSLFPSRPLSAASISRPSTPSQFVFKKPEYNSHYHHTHFHHLEKKDTIFHDLKKFFKKNSKKKTLLMDDTSSVQSGSSSVYSRQSDLSFANEFNKNLEGRYGKWGKLLQLF